MAPHDPWLAAAWTFVRPRLPPSPASVLEIGCGALGGFVPALLAAEYEAVGLDPNAPDGPAYRRVKFEDAELATPVDAVVACTSLHHVADLDQTVNHMATTLHVGGTVAVVEWAWERFDEATAEWCFSRLAAVTQGTEPGWLHRHQERWRTSRQPWDDYLRAWATEEGLHTGERIIEALDMQFERTFLDDGPYFFCDLNETSEADEQDAINGGEIGATCLRYLATRRW